MWAAGQLRAELARQRKSSSELAEALHLSQSAASRRLTGEISMDLDELSIIAAWLQVPVSSFMSSQATGADAVPEPPLVFPQRVARQDGAPLVVPDDDEAVAA